jgi:hypothetical protein
MSERSIFKDEFDLAELHYVRTPSASRMVALTPLRNITATLPAGLGRATLTYYRHQDTLYARLVAMQTGEVAWYLVTPAC